MTQELIQSQDRVPARHTTPADLLSLAVEKGADMDRLSQLMDLQLRWESNEARKAYHMAMAAFKADPVTISKDRTVSYPGKDGKPGTEFKHATLGNVVAIIAPALGKHKLSHAWGVKREADRVHVTCRLTHADGHGEEITLDGPLDSSGSKNNIQSLGSTITYLERYTLLAITGLATEDQDDDGRMAYPSSASEGPALLDGAQVEEILALLASTGSNTESFLKWVKANSVSEIPAAKYQTVVQTLRGKLPKGEPEGQEAT